MNHLSNFDQSEHKNWTVAERDQRVKPLCSLLVFLNDWLNFGVRDQSEIKMLIARGHSDISLPADVLWGSFVTECVEAIVDINATLSVIISLFCCRSLYLCISLSRCLCLFILALSRSACRRFSLQFLSFFSP